MSRVPLTLLALGASMAAHAGPAHSYGDTLIDGIRRDHRDIAAIEIRATAKDGSEIRLTRGIVHAGRGINLPLTNSMSEVIGTITLEFVAARHAPAPAIAYEASRRIYLANNLIEPDPFVAGAHRSKLAQSIVDRTMAANPDLVTLGMHVGATGANNTILASNFGRIGKPGDKDDARVIDAGAILKEPTNCGKRLAVSLPLLDRKGRVVGALSTSFLIGPGGMAAAEARAIAVRDAIARQIPSLAAISR